jgi:hypothetical protein
MSIPPTVSQGLKSAQNVVKHTAESLRNSANQRFNQALNQTLQRLPVDKATLVLKQTWHQTEADAWKNFFVAHFGPAFLALSGGSFAKILFGATGIGALSAISSPLLGIAAVAGSVAGIAGIGSLVNKQLADSANKSLRGVPNDFCKDAIQTITETFNQLFGRKTDFGKGAKSGPKSGLDAVLDGSFKALG